MKKSLISVVFLFLVHFVNAQDNTNVPNVRKWELGIEAGPNATWQTPITNTFLLSFSAGFAVQYRFTPEFSIKTGIVFEQKGNYNRDPILDSHGSPTGGSIIENDLFDYLVLPLLARYNFGGSRNFFVNAGPYFGYLLNETDNISVTNGSFPPTANNSTQLDNRFEVGASLGIGLGKQLSTRLRGEIELRGNIGLTPVIAPTVLYNAGIYNESINLLFGLRYKLFE